MQLRYATITGVARDDLPDGGAWLYAETVRKIHELNPDTGVENLIPDFNGKPELLQEGFEVTFTEPVAGEVSPEQVLLSQYDYDYWWEYGSPERGTKTVDVLSTALSEDKKTLTILTAGLTPAMCARCVLKLLIFFQKNTCEFWFKICENPLDEVKHFWANFFHYRLTPFLHHSIVDDFALPVCCDIR